MSMRITLPALCLSLLTVACTSTGDGALAQNPRNAFADLEHRLMESRSLSCDSRLTAEGAVTADVLCRHEMDADGRARVRAQGEFMGQPVDFTLFSDGQGMWLISGEQEREFPQPDDLRGGLLLGLSRMGWLHNVAMMSAGQAPEATDGSVTRFARALDLAAGEDLELGGRDRRALTFAIEVGGEPAGNAVLWLDVETGLPLERWQRVPFPEGEMKVVEVYERFELDVELGSLGPDGFE